MKKVCKCKRAYENPLSEICSLCWNELYPNEKDKIKDEDLLESKQETLEEVERMYSEEEAYKIWKAGQEYWKTSGESITFEELIEQFKKK